MRPHYDFTKAERVLALDSDFLHAGPGFLQYARDFTQGRKVQDASEADSMNRLYSVESNYTLTGAMADHRLRAASSHIPALACLFAAEILEQSGGDSSIASTLRSKGASLNVDAAWVKECAKDLVQHRGTSVVVVGDSLPKEVQLLGVLMNQQLRAVGSTINYLKVDTPEAASIESLAEAMEAGKVDTLVILGGNPVYNAPANLNWSKLQEKVSEVVRYGYYFDETSELANIHLAASHYLESWSDGRTWDGTVVPVQPMIEPIFSTMSENEVLAHFVGANTREDRKSVV